MTTAENTRVPRQINVYLPFVKEQSIVQCPLHFGFVLIFGQDVLSCPPQDDKLIDPTSNLVSFKFALQQQQPQQRTARA